MANNKQAPRDRANQVERQERPAHKRLGQLSAEQYQEANPDHTFRFVNDEGNNIQNYLDQGWDFVKQEQDDKRAFWRAESKTQTNQGSYVIKSVGKTKEILAYLMTIPKEEALAIRRDTVERRADEIDAALGSGKIEGASVPSYAANTGDGGQGLSQKRDGLAPSL